MFLTSWQLDTDQQRHGKDHQIVNSPEQDNDLPVSCVIERETVRDQTDQDPGDGQKRQKEEGAHK
ncbi:hypothetical protein, partial [Escherichia coli]|uniref:hypothetical protein n=2 Tax=Pseudomonadota TaxID=1224 RepID=UPI0013B3F7FD